MDNRRVPISVSNNPSDYSGRSIRLGNTDIREKMNQRMREFEEESRKWREQFLNSSSLHQPGSLLDRPRMFFNFPEFPELSPSFSSPLSSRLATNSRDFFPSSASFSQNSAAAAAPASHRSFMEEDDHGNKKFKITFDIGDFKPNEISVKTDGRQLIVKGDREVNVGSTVESKTFNREITLPDFVEPTSVQSFLSEGVLTVEAPIQLERLSYGGGAPVSAAAAAPVSGTSTSSSSTVRHSPHRDTTLRNNTTTTAAAASPSNSAYTTYSDNNGGPVVYKFNMAEFRPEDIAITVTDTTLKVHAVHEDNDYQTGAGNTYREFKREIGLPHGADVKRLKNSLHPDGALIIEIPVDGPGSRPSVNSSTSSLTKQLNNFSLDNSSHHASSGNRVGSLSSANIPPVVSSQQNSPEQHQSLSNIGGNSGGLINSVNDGKELRLTFDLTGYKPEDLSIKVIDNNTLKIHAVHIDNTRGNQIHREYTRQYQLPDWVQPEYLRARMSENGTLTVEVPVPQVQPSKYERVINIQNH